MGVSWDGTNSPLIGQSQDTLYLMSGQFSGTIKDSEDVQAIEGVCSGISTDDVNGRLGAGAAFTPTAVIF